MKKIIAVDFYDLVWQRKEPWTPEAIDRLFAKYAENGVDAVLWRLSACGKLLYQTTTPDRLDCTNNEICVKCVELLKRFDPAEAAVAAGRKNGIEVHFWLTLYDDRGYGNNGLSSSICREHPEYSWRSHDGRDYYSGMLSYVYPEVVDFRMRQVNEINSYGGDGLYLCNRSHSRPPEVRDEMDKLTNDVELSKKWCREKSMWIAQAINDAVGNFGFDPPALDAFGKEPDDLAEWQHFRGKYFLDLIQKIRKATPGKLSFGLRYGRDAPGFVFGKNFFDWERLSDGSLLDAIAYRLPVPPETGNEEFKEFYTQRPVKKWLWMTVNNVDQDRLIDAYMQQWDRWQPFLDGVIFFEAYYLTDDNKPYWNLIRNLK